MNVALFMVPYDSGHRGVRMGAGPEHLIENGFVRTLEHNGHRVHSLEVLELPAPFRPEISSAFQLNTELSRRLQSAVSGGSFPLVLAGNCNSSLGIVAGLGKKRVGLLWFDGHGDYNTPETTLSGFLDGMALAIAAGLCWRAAASRIPGFAPLPEHNIMLIGARDFDEAEKQLLNQSQIRCIPCDQLSQRIDEALAALQQHADSVIIHVDLDVLDPTEAPANHYSPPHGISATELIDTVRRIKRSFPVDAVCIASYDPDYDPQNKTADVAKQLALACLE